MGSLMCARVRVLTSDFVQTKVDRALSWYTLKWDHYCTLNILGISYWCIILYQVLVRNMFYVKTGIDYSAFISTSPVSVGVFLVTMPSELLHPRCNLCVG